MRNFKIRKRTKMLFRLKLFRRGIRERLKLMTFRNGTMNVNIRRLNFFPFTQRQIIQANRNDPGLCDPSTKANRCRPHLKLFPNGAFRGNCFKLTKGQTCNRFRSTIMNFRLTGAIHLTRFNYQRCFKRSIYLITTLTKRTMSRLLTRDKCKLNFNLHFSFL